MASTWFSQFIQESMWWDAQGGMFLYATEDNFIYAMQGFNQKLLPASLEVSIVSENKVVAAIPNRHYKSTDGMLHIAVTDLDIEVSIMRAIEYEGGGQTWIYSLNSDWSFQQLAWDEWNTRIAKIH